MNTPSKISNFLSIKDNNTLLQEFSELMKQFGATYCSIYGGKEEKRSYSTYPKEWLNYYFKENFSEKDPLHKEWEEISDPIFWESTHPKFHFMKRCREYGINFGVSFPFKSDAAQYIVTYCFTDNPEEIKNSKFSKPLLESYAALLSHKINLNMISEHSAKFYLTKREIECLRWASIGKTAEEIGIILSLSSWTIRFHLKNIYEKLAVNNKSSAISRAIELKIL